MQSFNWLCSYSTKLPKGGEKIKMTNSVKGLTVSGETIADAKDKTFFVCAPPHYEIVADLRDSSKTKEKLIVPVLLPDGDTVLDYYPNKTSIKMMCAQYGFDMD